MSPLLPCWSDAYPDHGLVGGAVPVCLLPLWHVGEMGQGPGGAWPEKVSCHFVSCTVYYDGSTYTLPDI